MNDCMKKIAVTFSMLSVLYTLPALTTLPVSSQAFAEEVKEERKAKKVPAMRNRVYTQLARAQKLADEGDTAAGLAVLDEVKKNIKQLNEYEQAVMWNFYGFMYYGNEDLSNAITSFKNVVAQVDKIPDSLYLSTTYSLAQLSMQQEDYSQALSYLNEWKAANTKDITANQYIIFAQVHYQDRNYQAALDNVEAAIGLYDIEGKVAKEQWLILQRAAFYELKQPKKVAEVIEKLVKHYEKPAYWIQLAGMYGEIGEEAKQLGAVETAYQAGYITKEAEIMMLAQIYMYNNLPYKAADLLNTSIKSGKLVANEKRLELMSQAYMLAKEDQKAIPVLIEASNIAETGKFDAQLAQSYLNLDKWLPAISSANEAIARGQLDNIGNMYLVLGMSNFNLNNFDKSIAAFTKAAEFTKTAKTAKQWIPYVTKEQSYQKQLAMLNKP